MSKISIEGNASGTGTLTIAAPNTSTNYTLSLPEEAGTITTSNSPYSTFRNRIINGDMRIDQRNAGAAVTASDSYPVDRFQISDNTDGDFSGQQDSSAPAGFVNSTKITITTADATLGSTQRIVFYQSIEGTNTADFGWGTASAKTVTLSFWVRSSLTGTFGGSVRNSATDRSYPFTYSISVADTWEYKTVTIPGDTSGTWLTTTGTGLTVFFGLGVGSDRSGTAGAWAGANYLSATGATSVIGTLNATWYITGVQLEVGSVATPFERRPYGTELILCQRYFEKSYNQTVAVGTASSGGYSVSSVSSNTVPSLQAYSTISFAVVKRAAPSIVIYGYSGGSGKVSNWTTGADLAANSGTVDSVGTQGFNGYNNSGGTVTTTSFAVIYHWTASSEL